MGRRGRGALVASACAAMLAVAASDVSAAAPSRTSLATVTAATPLSGGGGWLVWSTPQGSGYALMGYHDGVARQLSAVPRPQPFDASVGSDAAGAPVVTFSRCARTPQMRTPDGEQGRSGGGLLEPETGSGCHIVEVVLASGREVRLPIPRSAGASDTTPSMWHGQVTFARRSRAHGEVWQIVSWSPHAPRRLVTLPHGRVPSCPERRGGCTERAHGRVEALDRDGSIVTFLWTVPQGEGVTGEGAWEVRVDRSDGSSKALAEGGFGHEACTAPHPSDHELEYIWPEAPIASGEEALVPNLYAFSCFQGFASVLTVHGAVAGHASTGKLEAVAIAVASDDGHLYGLVPASATPLLGADSPGCSAASPCRIEPLATPPLRREREAPFVPFP
jgi:hypothetical protein